MAKIIKLTQTELTNIINNIISEQKENINPKGLKFGDRGPDVTALQQKLMDLGYLKLKSGKPTSYFGKFTKSALDRYNGIATTQTPAAQKPAGTQKPAAQKPAGTTDTTKPNATDTTKQTPVQNKPTDCISLPGEVCSKLTSNSEVKGLIDPGGNECSQFMTKMLKQYNPSLYAGNAWDAFNNLKGGGTVKYNAFTNEIFPAHGREIFTLDKIFPKIFDPEFLSCIGTEHSDKQNCGGFGTKLVEKIVSYYPNQTSMNPKNLTLGDIVGMYYKPSSNKGFAFMSRLAKRHNDKSTDPFTFNTHVGYVTAIKNGMPIISHNIDGTVHFTPANQALSKNGNVMMVWVISNQTVATNIKNGVQPTAEKKGWFSSLFS